MAEPLCGVERSAEVSARQARAIHHRETWAPGPGRSRPRPTPPLDAKMHPVTDDLPQPQLDHLSSLAALVLLAYGLVRIINLPTLSTDISLFGLVIPLTINTRLIMLSLAAALAVVGADWLVRSHPGAAFDGPPMRHWIIPGLAALGVGGLLTRLPSGPPPVARPRSRCRTVVGGVYRRIRGG